MSLASIGLSAIGKLLAVALLLGAFLFGMATVVYMSLQGKEIQVPDITGKNFNDSEKELALLGLKIKKRADRPSTEQPNTVIEQLPKAGDTVKTGQMILVVTSKPAEGDEVPASLKKTLEEDDTEKIEEMITDKPKKAKPNANANANRKKADTSRDTTGGNSNSSSNSNSTSDGNSNKKETGANPDKGNKSSSTPAANKPAPAKPADRPRVTKP